MSEKGRNQMKPQLQPEMKRSWWRSAALVVTALAASVVVTACGKGGGGGGAPIAPGPVHPSCPTCPGGVGGSSLLGTAIGHVFSSSLGQTELELALEFFSVGTHPQSGIPISNGYVGPVYAQGTMYMHIPSMLCNVPAGHYTVQTVQPGQWGGGGQSFGGLMLDAFGPTHVRVYIPSAFVKGAVPAAISIDGRQFPFRIQGRVQVQAINSWGYYCDMIME